jgi:predicted nucleic acid-binding protein
MSDTPAPKTPVVVDASVGMKWFVPEPHEAEALALLDDRFDRHVPAHFYVEAASRVWKKVVQRGELSEEDGRDVRTKLGRVRATIHPTGNLLDPAIEIALVTRRTVYDCLYIALAERLDCVAVTADERLYNATRGGPYAGRVHWVAHRLGPGDAAGTETAPHN